MRKGGEAEIVGFESGCVIWRAADHAEAILSHCRWDVLRVPFVRKSRVHAWWLHTYFLLISLCNQVRVRILKSD